MEDLIRDWKTTLHKHRRSLGASLTTAFVLAVAAGTNAAIYALADNYYLGSGSSRHDDVYLVGAAPSDPEQNYFYRFHNRLLEPLEKGLTSFKSLVRVGTYWLVLSNIERPRRLDGLRVGAGSTEVLKITVIRGRTFRPFDFEPGAEKTLLLGHHIWVSAFGSSEDAVGRLVHVNGVPHRVIGILPDDFNFKHTRYDVVTPSSFEEPAFLGASFNTWLAGLLKDGVTPGQAVAEVQSLEGQLVELAPPRYLEDSTLDIQHINQRSHTLVQMQISLLLTTGGILLIIAAANLCSVALVQLNRRRSEYALRVALGASRWHIVRLFALENGTIVLFGYVLAVFFGYLLIRIAATRFIGADWGLMAMLGDDIHLNWRILLYTLVACILVLVLLSLTTFMLSSSGLLAAFLKEEGRGLTESKTFKRLGHVLRFLQVSATCIALVAGGFFLLSMQRISKYDYGYSFDNIARTDVRLPVHRFLAADGTLEPNAVDRLHLLMNSIVTAVRQVPRVSEVALSKLEFPHWGEQRGVRLPDTPPHIEEQNLPRAKEGFVGPGFFEMVGMQKIQGDFFSPLQDRPDGEPVIVINDAFARRYFRGGSPLDQFVEARGRRNRVIGVVSNARRWQYETGVLHGLPLENQAEPAYYLPNSRDNAVHQGFLFIKTPTFDTELEQSIRAAIRRVDAEVVVGSFGSLRTLLDQRENTYKLIVFVQALLAAIVLLLACVAIYSAVSRSVAQRKREIGIRVALGATPERIRSRIFSYTLLVAAPGTFAGLVVSYIGLVHIGFLQNQLHLVDVADLRIYLYCSAGLLVVGLLAGLRPAFKAASMSPTEVLREA